MNRTILHAVAALAATVALLGCRATSAPSRTQDVLASERDHPQVDDAIAAYFVDPAAAKLYAGTYVDNEGRTVVLVTGNVEGVRSALLTRLPPGGTLLVRPARFSLKQLNHIVEVLTQRIEPLRAAGIIVASVAVDEEVNRVVVGLQEDSARARATVNAELPAGDRAALTFEVTGPNELE